MAASVVSVKTRTTPICKNVPAIGIGNKPIDGGNYLFTEQEKEDFIRLEAQAGKWFKIWIGADEFINGYRRYCLWLGDCPPNELKAMPLALQRVEAVRQFRLASKSLQTRKLADTPRKFHVQNTPPNNYIMIPRHSSENRRYVPIGFLDRNIFAGDSTLIVEDATFYHFGILTSNVHMAWARTVAGRLEMRYRYSKNVVYNNFPWPDPNSKQREDIEKAAQAVLDARALYPDSSLADLYDPLTMPPELLKAHNNLDRVVLSAYELKGSTTEAEIVAHLFQMYQRLVANQ